MVHASDLPPIHPQWHPRQMTPVEVLLLANRMDVPGANLDDPVVKALRGSILGTMGRLAITEARDRRALILKGDRSGDEWHRPARYVWGWWCAAAKWPEVIAQGWRDSYRVTVDLAPMERKWHLHALPAIGSLIEQCELVSGFLIGIDTLEVDGVEFLSALHLTDRLVELLRDRRNLTYRTLSR